MRPRSMAGGDSNCWKSATLSVATAKRLATGDDGLPRDFLASQPQRSKGQAKPERMPIAATIGGDPEQFVRAALHNI